MKGSKMQHDNIQAYPAVVLLLCTEVESSQEGQALFAKTTDILEDPQSRIAP